MLSYSIRRITIITYATLVLLTLSYFQPIIRAAEPPATPAIEPSGIPGFSAQNGDGVVLLFSSLPGGIARGQTFRVTLANFIQLDGHDQNPVEVRARVRLFDSQGRVIAQTAEVTVAKNQFRSFDFNRDRLPLPGDERTGRLQVREELTVHCNGVNNIEAFTIKQKASEFLPASSELIESSTGESRSLSPCLPLSAWLQDRPAGNPNAVGFVYGQTLRVNALDPDDVRQPGELLRVRVRLADAQGNIIAQSAEVTIPVGRFHSFDFNRNDIPLPGEPGTGRLQVAWSVVAFTQGSSPRPFPLTIELVETSTGASSTSKVGYAYQAVPLTQG